MPDVLGGVWLESCPVFLMYNAPLISEVLEAHRWAKVIGQNLSDMYPTGIPIIIQRGVIAIDAGLELAQHERFERIKQEQRDKASSNGVHGR